MKTVPECASTPAGGSPETKPTTNIAHTQRSPEELFAEREKEHNRNTEKVTEIFTNEAKDNTGNERW